MNTKKNWSSLAKRLTVLAAIPLLTACLHPSPAISSRTDEHIEQAVAEVEAINCELEKPKPMTRAEYDALPTQEEKDARVKAVVYWQTKCGEG